MGSFALKVVQSIGIYIIDVVIPGTPVGFQTKLLISGQCIEKGFIRGQIYWTNIYNAWTRN
jgi:hypothetical protein